MADRNHLIFINYRGSDQNWAAEVVYARMTEDFGRDAVFKAGNSIESGQDFPSVLRREAASCPVMLVCIGPGWLGAGSPGIGRRLDEADDWVRREIAIALAAGNHAVPLLIGNFGEVEMPAPDRLPEDIRALAHRQAWRLAAGGGLDLAIPQLIARLAGLDAELAQRRGELQAASDSAAGKSGGAGRPSAGVQSGGDRFTQHNTASGRAVINANQHGDQCVHYWNGSDPTAFPEES